MRRIAAALLALLALAACQRGGGDADAGGVLRVGSQKGGTKAVMLASGALEGAPYKVEWSDFPAAQHLLEAIGAGAVDLGMVGDAAFIFAYQSGSPIRAVGAQTFVNRPRGSLSVLVPANSPIRSLADLKDKRIATIRGSIGHYLVLRALAQAHLRPDWVKLIFLAPADAKAALSSGAADAWAIWIPYTSVALKEGARIVVDSNGLTYTYGLDIASEQAIASRRALIADFLRREAKALAWAKDHPREFATVLSRETGLPPDVALDFARRNRRYAIPIDDRLIAQQYVIVKNFQDAGAIAGGRDISPAFDKSFNGSENIALR